MFSYLLGDNHPHVLAMPVVLFVIALACNLLLLLAASNAVAEEEGAAASSATWLAWLPLRPVEIVAYVLALGSLVFLNTWDFPPYWLLMMVVVLLGSGGRWSRALAVGAALLIWQPRWL